METPVLFLVFNRPDTTAKVFEAIRAARPSRLYVAADGPRASRPDEASRCDRTRAFATAVDWECEVRTLFRAENLGCKKAVSSAIDWFFENEAEGIILEDDCLPSPDFFAFCGDLLEHYRDDERVMSVCGSSYSRPETTDSYYFSYYADMWGWATWRRAWRHYDRDLARWPQFKAQNGLASPTRGEDWVAADWTARFDATKDGIVDTWDYQWIYTVIEQNGLACYPAANLVSNVGWDADATHTIVTSAEQLADAPANRPHEPLEFPLRRPLHLVRSPRIDAEIEAVRLGMRPPVKDKPMNPIRSIARRVVNRLPESWRGRIDYHRFPEQGIAWGGPFNGQHGRRAIYQAVLEAMKPVAIVETGTYRATTTELFAESGLPIFTAEGSARNYGFASARMSRKSNVRVLHGDSRAVLRRVLGGPLAGRKNETLFVYLDAHWNADLPLAEEIDIVFTACPRAVVMIDDFQVPGDDAYRYDDYGPGSALDAPYIAPHVSRYGLGVYYPALPGSEEGGAKRGCVILAKDEGLLRTLDAIPVLKRANATASRLETA